jgi:hypothetical protein
VPVSSTGRRRRALQQVVDRRDAAVGVAGRSAEAEQRRRQRAIDRKAGSGDRARAERVAVRALERRLQPSAVAFELLDDGEQVVGDGAGLRALVCACGGRGWCRGAVGEVQQRPAQREGRGGQAEDQLPLPHPVHRHVDVVARARRVQAARHVVAAGLDHQALDVEEQVLVGAVVGDLPNRVLRHAVQGIAQGAGFAGGDDSLRVSITRWRVVNRHQRRQQELLRVLEVLVQH